jgi:hypothetical protein
MGGQVFRVRLDLLAIQTHLSAEDKAEISVEQVRQFLLDSGFVPDGEWWVVNESNLSAVDPGEVIEAEIVGAASPKPRPAAIPPPGELREYEEELDWRENRRRARRPRSSWVGPLVIAATSFAAGMWLGRKSRPR